MITGSRQIDSGMHDRSHLFLGCRPLVNAWAGPRAAALPPLPCLLTPGSTGKPPLLQAIAHLCPAGN